MNEQRVGLLGRGAAILAMALLSFGPIIVKDTDLASIRFAQWRLVAALGLYLVLLYASGARVTWRVIRLSTVGGVFFAVNIATFFQAVKNTSTANAVVIGALQPAFLLVVVGPLFGEKPRRSLYLWTAVAIGGVALSVVASGDTEGRGLDGDIYAAFAALLFAGYYVASKQARVRLDTLEYQFGLTAVAAVTMVPILFLSGQEVSPPSGGDWVPVILMALIPGTGHLLNAYAFRSVSLTVMSLVGLAVPVVTSLYAWWLIDEELVALQIVGIAIVVAALGVVVTRPTEQARSEPS